MLLGALREPRPAVEDGPEPEARLEERARDDLELRVAAGAGLQLGCELVPARRAGRVGSSRSKRPEQGIEDRLALDGLGGLERHAGKRHAAHRAAARAFAHVRSRTSGIGSSAASSDDAIKLALTRHPEDHRRPKERSRTPLLRASRSSSRHSSPIAVGLPAVRGTFIRDDWDYVAGNPHVVCAASLRDLFTSSFQPLKPLGLYRPVTTLSLRARRDARRRGAPVDLPRSRTCFSRARAPRSLAVLAGRLAGRRADAKRRRAPRSPRGSCSPCTRRGPRRCAGSRAAPRTS